MRGVFDQTVPPEDVADFDASSVILPLRIQPLPAAKASEDPRRSKDVLLTALPRANRYKEHAVGPINILQSCLFIFLSLFSARIV
jgi:hypothetical protein